ncbi:MAG: hypothetical protein K2N06_05490 [Oscillospiraceae bacterium]|nr:hypothetical protein [Oscillospiraceae bacterium]
MIRDTLPDKAQALYQFWSSFEWAAYDENSVPTGSNAPKSQYITYSVVTDNLGNEVGLTGSLWYRSSSWAAISQKAEEIAKRLENLSPIRIDGGYMWLKRGSPFAQRMSDPNDDMIRRIYINVTAEFLTAY